MVFYNEFDPFAAEWLRSLMAVGLIPEGVVDERSIVQLDPGELAGYTQVHLFAGIGGWPLALRLAGWPDSRPCWSGSCPCQPFSAAGKGEGEKDPRHLWPEFRRLLTDRQAPVVFGEQVASGDGRRWLAGVRADLEALGYAVGAADLCGPGVGAPHIRQRLFWVADAERPERWAGSAPERGVEGRDGLLERPEGAGRAGTCGEADGLADHQEQRFRQRASERGGGDSGMEAEGVRCRPADDSRPDRLADADGGKPCDGDAQRGGEHGLQPPGGGVGPDVRLGDAMRPGLPLPESGELRGPGRGESWGAAQQSGGTRWGDFRIVICRDGKARRVSAEPGDEPLAHGIPSRKIDPRLGYLFARLGELGHHPADTLRLLREARRNRVGRLKGYGNAIIPELAAVFIRAFMEAQAA